MSSDRIRPDLELSDGLLRLKPLSMIEPRAVFAAIMESRSELIPWMPWCHPGYLLDELKTYLQSCPEMWQKGSAYEFAITESASGRFLGGCGLNQINSTYRMANLGYWVRTGEIGRGVASAPASLLAGFGLEELHLVRIEIVIALENTASLRVAEKVGARREGILRNRMHLSDRTHDAVMHSFIPGDLKR